MKAPSCDQTGKWQWMPGRAVSPPENAGQTVNISYSTQPSAQMSVRLSTGFPLACSGLM